MDEISKIKQEHYHFIGIGGIGMGAIASLMLEKGLKVSGSDLRDNAMIKELRKKGAMIYEGHHPSNIKGADVVVYSSAVKPENVEFASAIEKDIPLKKRAQVLAQLTQNYTTITIAGAHGKTTTTSMTSNLLTSAGLQPTSAVGGIVNSLCSNAKLGAGKYFVAEVDESDGSFLNFYPHYSIITNIDFEHVDHYGCWDNIIDAYRQYISQTRDDGLLIYNGDDLRLNALASQSTKPQMSFGFGHHNHVVIESYRTEKMQVFFECFVYGKSFGEYQLNIPGPHNILNALACIGLGYTLGLTPDVIREGLKSYLGVQRRFQVIGEVDQILVVDDYAHHPTEVKMTLKAARDVGKERVVAVFQPHRYSRLAALKDEFANSLREADCLIITDVYAASEKPMDGVSAQALYEQMKTITGKPVFYVKKENLIDNLLNLARPGDLIITLGAGDINAICKTFVEQLKQAYCNLPELVH